MKTQRVEHGATLTFEARFLDENGDPVAPTSPVVVVSFADISTAAITRAVLSMTDQGDGTFTADWDSGAALASRPALWNVRSAGSIKASEFGRLDFDHNAAGLPD